MTQTQTNLKKIKTLTDAGISFVGEHSPEIQAWIDRNSQTRRVTLNLGIHTVRKVTRGKVPVTRTAPRHCGVTVYRKRWPTAPTVTTLEERVRQVEKVMKAKIVAFTGLRSQHMVPREQCPNVPQLPQEWYDKDNTRMRENDPFGVYTRSGFAFLKDFYKKVLVEEEVTAVITGGALFVDQLVMAAAQELRLPTLLAVPMDSQMSLWPEHMKRIYITQAKKADLVVLVSETSTLLDSGGNVSSAKVGYAMNRRNRFMVRHAHSVISTWRGTSGGTKNCIKDAIRMGREVRDVYGRLMTRIGYQQVANPAPLLNLGNCAPEDRKVIHARQVEVREQMNDLHASESFTAAMLYQQAVTLYDRMITVKRPALALALLPYRMMVREVVETLNGKSDEDVAGYLSYLRSLHRDRQPQPSATTPVAAD